MYICLCHGVSDRRIHSLIDQGCATVREIQKSCKAGMNCGMCINQLRDLTESRKEAPEVKGNPT